MNKKGIFALMGMLAVAACIVVSVLAQPVPIANVTIASEETIIFDTGPSSNPYPSIAGTHRGTITPAKTLNVSKVFTYPCEGTGGHSEYVWIHGNGVNETVTWGGYSKEWHKLTFGQSFLLAANKTYYYEIKTGSYPQIHHRDELEAKGGMGIINCSSFVDVDGRSHDNWIPAIRLEGYFVDGEGVHNIYTGKNFTTIQSAIDDNETQDGHTIEVDAGTYVESVNVTKRLTLRGIGMPTVDANGTGSAITISADGCVVDGFFVTGGDSQKGNYSVRHDTWNTTQHYPPDPSIPPQYYPPDAGIKVASDSNMLINNTAMNNEYGIVLWWQTSDNTVTNNVVSANKYDGIFLHKSPYNHIIDNVISDNDVGINLKMNCSHTVITGNTITSNRVWGLKLFIPSILPPRRPFRSHTLTIANNNVSNNGNGIYLFGPSNTVTGNVVSANAGYGMNLRLSCNNKLRNNVLYDNKYNFGVDCTGTTWDQDIDTTNTVDGKPIYFLVGKSGITIDNRTNAGYVGLVSCNKITVKNLNLTNNGQGIVVAETRGSTLRNNTIMDNEVGVHIYRSEHNIAIYHNNFESNTIQALNTWGWNIMWDKGPVEGGNYWSDHVCTGNPSNGSQPYHNILAGGYIPGGGTDNYPFEVEWGWVEE